MAAAQDLPEPAALGEKDQMGLARPFRAGLRPHFPWPVCGHGPSPARAGVRRGLPYPEERPSGSIPGHLGRGHSGGDWKGPECPVRTQDPEPADCPPLPASASDLGHTGVAVVPPPGTRPSSHCLSLPNQKPPLNPRLPHHPHLSSRRVRTCSWPSRGGPGPAAASRGVCTAALSQPPCPPRKVLRERPCPKASCLPAALTPFLAPPLLSWLADSFF